MAKYKTATGNPEHEEAIHLAADLETLASHLRDMAKTVDATSTRLAEGKVTTSYADEVAALQFSLLGLLGFADLGSMTLIAHRADTARTYARIPQIAAYQKDPASIYTLREEPTSGTISGILAATNQSADTHTCPVCGDIINGSATSLELHILNTHTPQDVKSARAPKVEQEPQEEPQEPVLICRASYLYKAKELHGKCTRPATGYIFIPHQAPDTPACESCGTTAVERGKRKGMEFYPLEEAEF